MNFCHPDDEDFGVATPDDACREQALYEGAQDTTRAWILTSFDSWRANPFYIGPVVPHPESDHDESEDERVAQLPTGSELAFLPPIARDFFSARAFRTGVDVQIRVSVGPHPLWEHAQFAILNPLAAVRLNEELDFPERLSEYFAIGTDTADGVLAVEVSTGNVFCFSRLSLRAQESEFVAGSLACLLDMSDGTEPVDFT